MAKILFDIVVAHESEGWLHCHLVMEISRHIFSYAIMDQNKKLVQLRFYELDTRDNHELTEELAGIISADGILTTEMEKKTFIYNFPESQLVPEKYFRTDTGAALIELLHGDLNNGITLSEKIQGRHQYNVYQVPAEIHGLLQQNFTNSRYWHYYSVWMALEQEHANDPATCLSVLFYPNRILVSAVNNKELQLLQSYGYEAAEDVAYYLLNICMQLHLSPEDTPVILSGMIDVSSVLYTVIFKYFGRLSLETFPAAATIPGLDEYPAHFFSPLLKLATCVS
jgi:Protein of unknown function (DUF3822)